MVSYTQILKYFNLFKNISLEKCPIKRLSADKDPSTILFTNSTVKSCFCQNIYQKIDSTFFDILKPIFLGKILYSPNTPAYNDLIKRLNSSFENLDNFGNLLHQVSFVLKILNSQLAQNKETVEFLIDIFNQNKPQFIKSTLPSFNYTQVNTTLRFTTELLDFLSNIVNCVELNRFIGLPTEKAVEDLGLKLIDKESFWAGIIFQNPQIDNSTLPDIVNYKIRMNSSQVHNTFYTQDRFYDYNYGNCVYCNAYYLFGFIYLQDLLERNVIEKKTNQSQEFGITGQMTPYPCFINDKFVKSISRILPLFMVLAWIYTVSMLVKDIVYEKEKRLKEFMRVMGLSNATHWAAWFITSFAVMFFVVFVMALILKFGRILQYSNFFVIAFFSTFFLTLKARYARLLVRV